MDSEVLHALFFKMVQALIIQLTRHLENENHENWNHSREEQSYWYPRKKGNTSICFYFQKGEDEVFSQVSKNINLKGTAARHRIY